jgi:hypothetical protein
VWRGTGGAGMPLPSAHAAYLRGRLSGEPDAPHSGGTVSAPLLAPAEGEMSLVYRLYDGPNGDCR